MASVITLPNGRNETVFDLRDLLELVETHLGDEARRLLEEYLEPESEDAEYIEYLEKEADQRRTHYKDVMKQLREQSETIARLIREKEIDRKALSHAAGVIGTVTWREMNVG